MCYSKNCVASLVRAADPIIVGRRLECSRCGATAKAGCDCGVAYLPAGTRAAAAVAAHPGLSDRAIAAEIGVDHKTVGNARKAATGGNSPVGQRTGLDGKTRKMPTRSQPKVRPSDPIDDDAEAARALFWALEFLLRAFDGLDLAAARRGMTEQQRRDVDPLTKRVCNLLDLIIANCGA